MHCALLASVWPNKIAHIVKISTEADVHGAQKVISNNDFRMANCFCCLTQNSMVCLAQCRQELQQKSLQDFFFKNETKTKCSRPRLHDPRPRDQDQDFHLCPRGTSRPRPWSRGLHHWFFISDGLHLRRPDCAIRFQIPNPCCLFARRVILYETRQGWWLIEVHCAALFYPLSSKSRIPQRVWSVSLVRSVERDLAALMGRVGPLRQTAVLGFHISEPYSL